MAYWLSYPSHNKTQVRKLAINIPSSVKGEDHVRVEKKGDAYAQNIYKRGGAYEKLAQDFEAISADCAKALRATNLKSTKLKEELREAKQIADKQAKACRKRRVEMSDGYSVTKNLFARIDT